jgi:O-antigen ligase
MSRKTDPFDYEPLTNTRSSSQTFRDDEFKIQSKRESHLEKRFHGEQSRKSEEVNSEPGTIQQKQEKDSTAGRFIFKSGHGVSFAGLYLFTFLLFFRPYEFSPSLMWLSRSALITAIVTLLIFVPTQLGLENRITVRPREVNLVLILVFFGLLSIPLAFDRTRAWNAWVEYVKVVIMFVVMVNVVRTEKRLRAIFLLVIVATVVLSVSAVNDYRNGIMALGGTRIAGSIGGIFENPNDLALHLVTFLPIVIALLLASSNILAQLFYVLVSLVMLGATVVTFSRSGFVGLLFVVGAFTWKLRRRNKAPVGLVAIPVILLFLLAVAPSSYRDRIATTGDASAEARTGELKRSIYLSLTHPIFGLGMDNFVLFSNTEHATHNAYTQVSSEIGIPAAITYILFLVAAYKRLRRIPHPKDVEEKYRLVPYLAVGLQASLIGYMATSFFASVAFLWYVYYLVAYGICLSRFSESSARVLPDSTTSS